MPPTNGVVGAGYVLGDAWHFEGFYRIADEQRRLSARDIADPRIDPSGTAGWTTFHAQATYRLSEALTMSLRLDNLRDSRYREHGSAIDGLGRNATLAAAWKF